MVDKGRRELLIQTMVTTVTAVIFTTVTNEVIGVLRDQAERFSDPFDYDLEAIKGVFGSIDVRSMFVPGQSHPSPRYPHFHPDDAYVADRFDELVTDVAERRVVYDSDQLPKNPTGTIVASGSPVSNKFSRQFLQYDFVDPADGMRGLIRSDNPVFDLDYEFLLSRESLGQLGISETVGRSGRTGNWSIIRKSTGDLYASEVSNGKLNTDFLLITCLPNVFDKEGLDKGEAIFLLAGAHGVGTKGADLLLKDSQILGRLRQRIGYSRYWQALFKVDGVDHFYDDPKFGTRWHPRRLDPNFEFSTVSFDEDRLAELVAQ